MLTFLSALNLILTRILNRRKLFRRTQNIHLIFLKFSYERPPYDQFLKTPFSVAAGKIVHPVHNRFTIDIMILLP